MVGVLFFAHKTSAQTTSLPNPLKTNDIRVLIGRVINASLGIVGAIALLMFVIGGYYWLVSGGSAKQIEKGRNTLVWASIGLVVVFGSYILVGYILQALTKG